MNLSRDNHFLPQMYLKRWSKEGKLNEFRLLVSHDNVPLWTAKSLKKVAVHENLYVRIEDGIEYDDIEHWFDRFYENPAVDALEKACNDKKMTSDDWSILLDFVLAQYVRTPAFHQWIMKRGKTIVSSAIDSVAGQLSSVTREEIRNFNSENDDVSKLLPLSMKVTDIHPDEKHTMIEIDTIVGKNLWLMCIKEILSDKSEVNQYFHSMKWSIASSPNNNEWPTCDSPFIIVQQSEPDNYQISQDGGIGNRDTLLVFPLSPSKVLLGTRTRHFQWRFTADVTLYNTIKQLIVDNAFMTVYSREEDLSIPNYRKRIVNDDLYKKIRSEYHDWYSEYQLIEAPFLKRNHIVERTE